MKNRLRDRIGAHPCVLFVGINPGLRSAEIGHHFAGYSNRFWKLLFESGLVPEPIGCERDSELPRWAYGITNLVARASSGIGELKPEEYEAGRRRLIKKISRVRPEVVALVGVTLHRALFPPAKTHGAARPEPVAPGLQKDTLSGSPVFVLPNPSGRNANFSYAQMLEAFTSLRCFLDDALGKKRCAWPLSGEMLEYHDREWGVPVHDDRGHFEHLILDTFQAGLSWAIVLKKRKAFCRAFRNFDPKKITEFGPADVERLIKDPAIIRNRRKIEAAIENARRFLEVQKEFCTFDRYIWAFVGNRPIVNRWKILAELPAKTEVSDRMSRDLKSRGFKFVGSTICYSYMQAAGLVNDHTIDCFRHRELAGG